MERQMMNVRLTLFICTLLATTLPALSQAKNSTQQQPKPRSTNQATQPTVKQNNGERVFEQNCSRCHNAPEGFSSRISGTIVRHMRTRANLSEQDAQAVLRFFNP
jgi:cytochrome c5